MTHKAPSLFDWKIAGPAIGDSFQKLDPRADGQEPGDVRDHGRRGADHGGHFHRARRPCAVSSPSSRSGSGSPCCSPISPRPWPKAAARPRRRPCARPACKPQRIAAAKTAQAEEVNATELRKGDVVVVRAGEVIPADGDVIEGAATVDESAITGESAPVIRESGGDRSAVTGGTRVLSDEIKIRISINPGEGFLDRMIAWSKARSARRRRTKSRSRSCSRR